MTLAPTASAEDRTSDAATRPREMGVLPCQVIRALIRSGEIAADTPFTDAQVQPASLDLRLGPTAYRVRASFLPGANATVEDKLQALAMHAFPLAEGAVLERGCVYIVKLQERLRLSPRLSAIANPRSSIGRLDVFTRLISDRVAEFERIPMGYEGPLYIEIAPRAFSIIVREGSRLNQIRFRRGVHQYRDYDLLRLQEKHRLVNRALTAADIVDGLPLTVDLLGDPEVGLIGYKARKHSGLVDLDQVGAYDPLDYWEPIHSRRDRGLILDPDDFYILASKEAVSVPPDHVAELVAYDTLFGEFRVHYAGFFDPGFGHEVAGAVGTRAVLEVRSHEVPFRLEDEQVVGRLMYERLTDVPDKLYGPQIGSYYQRQGLQLSKQFRSVS